MYYSDHGVFFDGDIHDATQGMHKWAIEASQPKIEQNVKTHGSYAFTCVRNPYTRILSSFFDKICGIQRNGKRYRGNLVPLLVQKYGIISCYRHHISANTLISLCALHWS